MYDRWLMQKGTICHFIQVDFLIPVGNLKQLTNFQFSNFFIRYILYLRPGSGDYAYETNTVVISSSRATRRYPPRRRGPLGR